MNDSAERNDRGHILIWTTAALAMIFIAMLLTARAFEARLDASLKETRAAEQRAAGDIAEAALDAWMSNPALADQIINGAGGRTPISPLGKECPGQPPGPPITVCWLVQAVTPVPFSDSDLRGGEAKRVARDITIEVAAGCQTYNYADCRQVRTITRRYERSVFAHYQLHYENDIAPDAAFDDPWFDGSDGIPDAADCATTVPPSCDDPPESQLRGLQVVFTSADTLNGPLRYSGNDKVLYCGTPKFKLIESKSSSRPIRAAGGCLSQPSWMLDDGTTRQWPLSDTDPLDADRFVVQGDVLTLPTISAPSGCPLTTVKYNHNIDTADKNRREANPDTCPDEPGQTGPHAILDGDIITSTGSVTIEHLVVEGSVTVYAEGDIIICGNIKVSGTNPAGGPNVIALLTEGYVVLDPRGPGDPSCESDPNYSPITGSDLNLDGVAILAPYGALYARNWYLSCTGTCPTFKLEGSIAVKHLGLYGIPNPSSGRVTHGWSKDFTYPTDDPNTDVCEGIWCARPPWWPGFSGSEWEPVGEVRSSDDIIRSALTVLPAAITVTEGSPRSCNFAYK